MAQSLLKQCENFGKWIWPELNIGVGTTDIFGGTKYSVAEIDENRNAIQGLTPFFSIEQLLGYLQGLWTAKNNPNIFNP